MKNLNRRLEIENVRLLNHQSVVAVLTSSPRNEDREQASKLGAAFYFVNPLSPKDYGSVIEKVREICVRQE